VADLTGFGHLAGGLAQGIQAGSRTALSWAGLKQQQQQIEMHRKQMEFNNDFKTLSAIIPMMDPRKFSDETVDSASDKFLQILGKYTDMSGFELPSLEDRKLERKLTTEIAGELTTILQDGIKNKRPPSHILAELQRKTMELPARTQEAINETEKQIQATVGEYAKTYRAKLTQEGATERQTRSIEQQKEREQRITTNQANRIKLMERSLDLRQRALDKSLNPKVEYKDSQKIDDTRQYWSTLIQVEKSILSQPIFYDEEQLAAARQKIEYFQQMMASDMLAIRNGKDPSWLGGVPDLTEVEPEGLTSEEEKAAMDYLRNWD